MNNLKLALKLHPMPSLMAGVEYTLGNRKLFNDLWEQMALNWYLKKDVKSLTEIVSGFMQRYESKRDVISNISMNFAHLNEINYPLLSNEFWIEHYNLCAEQKKYRSGL